MERLIALATATRRGGAALFENGEPVALREIAPPETGGARLLSAARGCLEEAGLTWENLTAVAVALGPGSFTGIRVGLATALGLVESLGLKLFGVGSLDCVARGARGELREQEIVCATLPAGTGLYYAQLFRDGEPLGGCGLVPADELGARCPAVAYIGADLDFLKNLANRILHHPDWVSPVHLGTLAWERLERNEADDPARIRPLYVKRPAARPTLR
ncbi:MAG: tRNA (adenosine(37)-N6)-threonylcarbamoyltransferase complex dimerization subunit type 1 TsaB [Candidatus Coatesbacteria bacterium RBG_13_66_14]|uniref:tRNA (Adenosine(37)-N6)-threonylcarbamoyltransferase complex dimerization subunit type 1 TsaB n=1 Tax=Candidatus Coatesbacteria bacterium RBG_13_66_14 TaxID=1817816 RepID=A0A1F5FH97_9BACT|nr:MAG: tRNA (adenosine(37)-N6)-threonylcarbamoyltransferase complex dimerization subunit type 1 TsaB [Candidatus Coatesbacteria bacterium RBG_13_66_14]